MNRPTRFAALMTSALGCSLLSVSATGLGAAPSAGATPSVSHSAPASTPHSSLDHGGPRNPPGSVGPASPVVPRRGPDAVRPHGPSQVDVPGARIATSRRDTTQVATNWSGQVEQGTNLSGVSGTWTVPTIAPSPTTKLVATWVGIGGFNNSTLIQTGTVEGTSRTAVGEYAWIEMLPNYALTVTLPGTPGGSAADTVAAGDAMHASISETSPNIWNIRLQDLTKGWVYDQSFSYAVTATSAEWITERPTGTGTTLYTLPEYGSVRFTHLEAASSGAQLSAPSGLTPILMETAGNVISAPGPVSSAAGVSFTDTFVHVPERIFGQSADGTAAVELTTQFPYTSGVCPGSPSGGRAVVLATDKTYPDALASAYLSSYLGTGTLLTPTTSVSQAALGAIRDEGITQVYVVGGSLALSTAVVRQLEATPSYACGGTSVLPGTVKVKVTRISGATQYDTAAAIVAEADALGATVGVDDLSGAYAGLNGSGGEGAYNATAGQASTTAPIAGDARTAVLATGLGFQDAEAASTLAYAAHLPILLTTPSSLSSQAWNAMSAIGIAQVIVMGGQLAVSNAVVSSLEAHGVAVLRIAGANDTQTATELATCELGSATTHLGFGWPATGEVTVSRGDSYADGLAGAVVAADGATSVAPEPLLLTSAPTTTGAYLRAFLQEAGTTGVDGKTISRIRILGGPDAVSQTVANTMVLDLLG